MVRDLPPRRDGEVRLMIQGSREDMAFIAAAVTRAMEEAQRLTTVNPLPPDPRQRLRVVDNSLTASGNTGGAA